MVWHRSRHPLIPLGFFGWSVDDAVYAYEAAAPSSVEFDNLPDAREKPRIIIIDDPLIADAEPDMVKAFTALADRFRAVGYTVEERPSPFPFERIRKLHWNNIRYEAGRALAHLLDLPENLVGRLLRESLVEGQSITTRQYLDERAELDQLRGEFFLPPSRHPMLTFGRRRQAQQPRASNQRGSLNTSHPGPLSVGLSSPCRPERIRTACLWDASFRLVRGLIVGWVNWRAVFPIAEQVSNYPR